MNERIKELVVQASKYADSVYRPPIRSKTPGKSWEDGYISWHELCDQKFSELIVRECIEQIIIREKDAGDWYQDEILKHFGVEE